MSESSPAPGILFDYARAARVGLPETVFCEGKPREALIRLRDIFAAADAPAILFTRLAPELAHEIFGVGEGTALPHFNYDPLSRTGWYKALSSRSGSVAIVSAGTADVPVTREVARTLQYLGYSSRLFEDCGVAGLWRLEKALPEINEHDVVVVVAGLDAAIASVLGGLTPLPIIGVPTSVGYGAAEKGKSALSSMLVSCAPGVSVMNIDNGYGAGCAAARILGMKYAK